MHLVEVEVVGVEATETLIDLLPDRCRAQIVADRSRVVPEEPALASDQDAVAATRQGLPEHLLGVAKSVDRGDVKVGNPEIDGGPDRPDGLLVGASVPRLSLIHISEPTRLGMISYAVFCLKKKN